MLGEAINASITLNYYEKLIKNLFYSKLIDR